MALPSPSSFLDGYTPSIILAVTAVLLLCWKRLSVQLAPQEPPLLKPTIPYIGHIVGLIKDQSFYFDKLLAKNPMPICTLPMINAKSYVVSSPALIQSAYRAKSLSFDPFVEMFAQRMLGVSDETMKPVKAPATPERPTLLTEFTREIHGAMMNEHLHRMNAEALKYVAESVNQLGNTFETDSLYIWFRSMMTIATSNSLYGSHNPLKSDPSLKELLWEFEAGIMSFILGTPAYFAPKAHKARAALQSALVEYYTAQRDLEPDVARITKRRADVLRRYGVPDEDVGRFELALLHVSTANAIPTLFWTFVFIANSASLAASIREELQTIIAFTKSVASPDREISINISRFSSHCPLLVSSYREATRLASFAIGNRRVMTDTTISDGNRSYLLKQGVDLMIPAGVAHMAPANFGPNAKDFDARRFLQTNDKDSRSEKEKAEEKLQRQSYNPFGGGKHLCPGRNFAFAEILGTVAILLLGFDATGMDGKPLQVPEISRGNMGEGIAKPRGEGLKMGARFVRREGWKDVIWKFTTDQEADAVTH